MDINQSSLTRFKSRSAITTHQQTNTASLSNTERPRDTRSTSSINQDLPHTDTTSSIQIIVDKALTASNLPMTERNRLIVIELLNHNMPIDKQTLQTIIKLSMMNKDASPLTLVLMLKNDIPLTPENIAQFEAYQNGSREILQDIHSMTDSLIDLLADPTIFPNERIEYNTKVMELINNQNENLMDTSNTLLSDILLADEYNQLIELIHQNAGEKMDGMFSLTDSRFSQVEQLNNATITVKSAVELIQHFMDHMTSISDPASYDNRNTTILNNMSSESLQIMDHRSLEALQSINNHLQETINHTQLLQPETISIDRILNVQELEHLANTLTTFTDDLMNQQISKGFASVQEVLNIIHTELPMQGADTVNGILQSPEYMKLIREALHQKWTITPEKLMKSDTLEDFYEQLQEDASKLKDMFSMNRDAQDFSRIQEPTKNLQDNMQFMKALNDMFAYIQLPIQFKHQDVHADLYVFTKKKALSENKKNLSVLLHLDMANLGPMNIHLQMDHNIIHSKFYIENTSACQLVKQHLPLLVSAIEKRGYQLHTEVSTSYKKPDFSKDLANDSSQDNLIQRFNFDIRA